MPLWDGGCNPAALGLHLPRCNQVACLLLLLVSPTWGLTCISVCWALGYHTPLSVPEHAVACSKTHDEGHGHGQVGSQCRTPPRHHTR